MTDRNPEFLTQFAAQGIKHALSGSHLAARKLPLATLVLMRKSLANEDLVATNHHADRNMNPPLNYGIPH